MTVTHTLAYYSGVLVAALMSFVVKALKTSSSRVTFFNNRWGAKTFPPIYGRECCEHLTMKFEYSKPKRYV